MRKEVRRIKNVVAVAITAAILILTVLGYIFDAYDYLKTKLFASADYTDSYVEMFDVGQGDSILIYSGGKAALIDTGIKSCADSITKTMKLKGIDALDMLLITHNHTDHMGGIVPLTEEFKIKNLVIPDLSKTDERTDKMQTAIGTVKASGGNCVTAEKGMSFDIGEFNISVIAAYYDEKDENDRSIITVAQIGKWRFLFTGDAQEPVEKRLIEDGVNIKCDVLKVGHHGSMYGTSEEFLEVASPSLAMISCGRGNRYSHPHDVVLRRLNEAGAQYYRTDINGSVTYTVDEKEITVKTEK